MSFLFRYTRQVIDETLRAAVVAPWGARVYEYDLQVDEYVIPKEVCTVFYPGTFFSTESNNPRKAIALGHAVGLTRSHMNDLIPFQKHTVEQRKVTIIYSHCNSDCFMRHKNGPLLELGIDTLANVLMLKHLPVLIL